MKIIRHRYSGAILHIFRNANLRGANLRGFDLRDADLCGFDLRDADLRYADLRGASLYNANLDGARLRCANLSDANLCAARISNVDLSYADLCYADLRGATMRDADLTEVSLMGTIGNMREVRSAQFDTWSVAWTAEVLQIGCQRHTIDDWFSFSDREIDAMSSNALRWWHKHGETIRLLVGYRGGHGES